MILPTALGVYYTDGDPKILYQAQKYLESGVSGQSWSLMDSLSYHEPNTNNGRHSSMEQK